MSFPEIAALVRRIEEEGVHRGDSVVVSSYLFRRITETLEHIAEGGDPRTAPAIKIGALQVRISSHIPTARALLMQGDQVVNVIELGDGT